MSICVIWSSPNTDGLTAAAKDRVIEGLKNAGADVEEIHLNVRQIEHCRACKRGWGTCIENGTCVIEDDFTDVYQRLAAADAIVWVTAVYWHDLTECMKAFVDRVRRCDTWNNKFLKEKKNMLIACAGGTGRGAIQCLNNMEYSFNHMNMTIVERLPVIRFNKHYMLPALKEAGEAFARSLE